MTPRPIVLLALLLAAPATLLTAPSAGAVQPAKSLYTSIDLAKCKVVSRHRDGNTWECEGLPGYPVLVAEGDLRTFVSFGPDARKRRAARQSLGPFNRMFADARQRATIEWRYVRRDGRAVPYATIIRFTTSRDGMKGQALVVTRIGDKDACHVAYVDAIANPDAIALAREAADGLARRFDCTKEPEVLGQPGRMPL